MHEVCPWLPVLRYIDMVRGCVQRIKERYKPREIRIIFALESSTPLERSLIDPMYKVHRARTSDQLFTKFKSSMTSFMNESGLGSIKLDGFEADDVIASICQNHPDELKVVFTNDRDLRQLLGSNVVIYQAPGFFYTADIFRTDYGFNPEHFVYYKALIGDKSDGISGVTGWGPVKAKKHISSFNWLSILEEENQKEEYWKAMELVRFRYNQDLKVGDVGIFSLSNEDIQRVARKIGNIYGKENVIEDITISILKLKDTFERV